MISQRIARGQDPDQQAVSLVCVLFHESELSSLLVREGTILLTGASTIRLSRSFLEPSLFVEGKLPVIHQLSRRIEFLRMWSYSLLKMYFINQVNAVFIHNYSAVKIACLNYEMQFSILTEIPLQTLSCYMGCYLDNFTRAVYLLWHLMWGIFGNSWV